MKKNKGFTLIELLAVIVVLAIIALIATPIIMNLVNNARKGAASASTISYVKAIETEVARAFIDNETYKNKDDYVYDEIPVDIKGTLPTGGIYSLEDGSVKRGTFCINGYEVKYIEGKTEVQGKCTGDDLKLSGSVKLSENSGYYQYPTTGTFEVTENISDGALSCVSNDDEVATCSINGTTVTVTPGKKEGTAELIIKSEGSSKYKESQVTYVAITAKGTLTSYTANGYTGTYDGSTHGITITSSGATIKYGTVAGNYVLDSSPTYTDVGEYTVYYQIIMSGYKTVEGSRNVVIKKAEGTVVAPTAKTITYTGVSQELINMGSSNTGTIQYRLEGGEYSEYIPTGINTGEYIVYYRVLGDKNHENVEEKSITVTINEATLNYVADGYSGTYDGKAHGITVTSSGAIIKYGTVAGSYTLTSSPTYTDVGTYTVYYQVTKAGYKTVTGSAKVVISEETIPVVAKKLVYDENGTCKTDGTTYNYMGGCYIKGANESNYVWYNGFMWRIMGINSDGTVRLITDENVTSLSYGPVNSALTYAANEGYIHDWLNEYFYNSLNSTKSIIQEGAYFCSESTNEKSLTKRQTCTSGSEVATKVGLISYDEYLLANSYSSYLNIRQYFLTITPYNASRVWLVKDNGNAYTNYVAGAAGVRPVINVSSDAAITAGDGSARNFFVLGEDKPTSVTGTLIDKATSGEYVILEGHTYRVVSKDSNGVKLILDGFYEETEGTPYTMSYGKNNTFTLDSGIGQKLNVDVLAWLDLNESDKIVPATYYRGDGIDGAIAYTDTLKQSNGVEAKVGLIQIGDILAGQSSTMLTKNYTTTSSYNNIKNYWTMNKYISASSAWAVNAYSYAYYTNVTGTSGVRPVIKVSPSVTISGGNGTWMSPYEI